jgi:uncharacterized protein YgiM (DUF1202 family)
MQRVVATIGGVLVLALIAGGLAEATIASGHRGSLANDILLRPAASSKKVAAPIPTPPTVGLVVTPKPTPSQAATTTPTPAVPTATTSSFVHMRAGESTSTAVIVDLNGGTTVQLLPDSNSQWQQVEYSGQTGYIFKTYLIY